MRRAAFISLICSMAILASSLAGMALAKGLQSEDNTSTVYGQVLGNRIPYEYFVTSGHSDTDIGPGDDPWETGSYDLALMNASIENFNVLKYTSVLPPESKEIPLETARKYFHHGAVIETIMSDLNGVMGDTLCTGVGRIWVRNQEGELIGGLAAEYKKRYENQIVSEEKAKDNAENGLNSSLMGEVNRRYNASQYNFSKPAYAIDYLQVQKNYGTSLVALCWVSYIFPESATQIGATNNASIEQ